MLSHNPGARLLKSALVGNGIFSVVSGIVTLLARSALADVMQVPSGALAVIGGGVTLFGLVIAWKSRALDRSFALGVILADLMWVAGATVLLVIPGVVSTSGKLILGGITVMVAGWAFLQARGLLASTQVEPLTLTTSVDIAASPDDVWAHLVDLESYSSWNPFITSAAGLVRPGETLRLTMQPPGGSSMKFAPTVTTTDVPMTIEWLGRLGSQVVFAGRHRFVLEASGEGTRMTHSEAFSGMLVPALEKSLSTKTRAGFVEMNHALKARAESGVRNSA